MPAHATHASRRVLGNDTANDRNDSLTAQKALLKQGA